MQSPPESGGGGDKDKDGGQPPNKKASMTPQQQSDGNTNWQSNNNSQQNQQQQQQQGSTSGQSNKDHDAHNCSDHVVALTQLREQIASLNRQLALKDQMLLAKERQVSCYFIANNNNISLALPRRHRAT
jgi:hypothetical protein